jgi:ABC-2 type transport system ATP-binding protein
LAIEWRRCHAEKQRTVLPDISFGARTGRWPALGGVERILVSILSARDYSHSAPVARTARAEGRIIPMSEPVISLDGLGKRYGDVQAVESLSFDIERGAIFGFLGANGAGKTTTIRMLCGLVRPTTGSASITGLDIWKDRRDVRTKFGYVAQRFSLYPDLTVDENMRFFGGAARVPAQKLDKRIKELLALTDLEPKRDTPSGALPAACGSCWQLVVR